MGIGAKTLMSHIILALFAVLLTSILSYALTYRYVRDDLIKDLGHTASKVAELMNQRLVSESEAKPSRKMVTMYQALTDARVFFLEIGEGSIRMWQYRNAEPADATTEEFQWVDVIGAIDREFFTRILHGETVSTMQQFEFTQGVVIFAGAPIKDDAGNVTSGVVLVKPVEEIKQLSHSIATMLVAVVGVSLLLAVLLATQQTRTLVGPMQRITRAARRMTDDSNYAERISNLPNDEIGDLGRAMNSMSARLFDLIKNLRKERDKLGLVISSIGEGLIAVDTEGRVVHYNPVFLELMELDAIDGLWEQVDDNIIMLGDMLKACMDTGQPGHLTWENHSGRALYAGATALTDEGGEIIGTVCLLRDTSEAARMEQIRRDYVANISHELRTPLTGIRGMVEPLIDGIMDTEEERQDSYRVILRETIRLEKLVGEMLDMSRLQDGRVKVELEMLEVPGILEAAARGMRQIAVDSGVELLVETDGTDLWCLGNEDRITQVLVILMDNALSFTPSGGRVTVYACDVGDRVAIGVRDTGCGIEPKDLPMIWDRFYKADKSRMRTTGTGLGLSIAKLVVELMEGEISVDSVPGKGADFMFTLKKQPNEGGK